MAKRARKQSKPKTTKPPPSSAAAPSKVAFNQASVTRRVGALVYDLFLLVGIWMVVAFAYTMLAKLLTGQPPEDTLVLQLTLFPLLLLFTFLFYGWCWTHGGRTLGMQSWHIRAVTDQGKQLSWLASLRRAIFAFPLVITGGIGLLWVAADRNNTALHDYLSRTRVVYTPKQKSS